MFRNGNYPLSSVECICSGWNLKTLHLLSRLLKNNMMRTSNKLFGLVILLVLTLPLLVVVFLLKSVREESFTTRDLSGQKISRGMYPQGYRTLKIVVHPTVNLSCHYF